MIRAAPSMARAAPPKIPPARGSLSLALPICLSLLPVDYRFAANKILSAMRRTSLPSTLLAFISRRTLSQIRPALLGSAASVMLMGCSPTYEGEGIFFDSGFWSYPRFAVEFDPLTEANLSDRFEIQSLPEGDYTLMLYWEGDGWPGNLSELTIKTRMAIQDQTGRIVCEVREPLSDFHLMEDSDRKAFWHEDCRGIRLNRGQAYSVSITLAAAPREGFIILPKLEGGGNEVP